MQPASEARYPHSGDPGGTSQPLQEILVAKPDWTTPFLDYLLRDALPKTRLRRITLRGVPRLMSWSGITFTIKVPLESFNGAYQKPREDNYSSIFTQESAGTMQPQSH